MERDTRIPVIFGQQPGADDMVLLEEGLAPPPRGQVWILPAQRPGHLPGCFCCTGRNAAATVLGALFRARAMGGAPYFNRLLAVTSPEGRRGVETALAEDALCRARYRLAG